MNNEDLDTRLRALTEEYPGRVSRVVTRRIADSTGDPAVWIWVILEDESLLEAANRSELERIRTKAEETARSVGGEWPYVTFRTESEQKEVEAESK